MNRLIFEAQPGAPGETPEWMPFVVQVHDAREDDDRYTHAYLPKALLPWMQAHPREWAPLLLALALVPSDDNEEVIVDAGEVCEPLRLKVMQAVVASNALPAKSTGLSVEVIVRCPGQPWSRAIVDQVQEVPWNTWRARWPAQCLAWGLQASVPDPPSTSPRLRL